MPKAQILEINQINFDIPSKDDLYFINKIERKLKLHLTSLKQFNFIIENQSSYFWKILFCDKIIGFVKLQGDKMECEILSIGIKRNFQGLGFGKKTIEFLIDKGFKNIFLEVSDKNKKAINFYYSRGFRKVYIRKNYYRINKIIPENAEVLNLKIN